MARFNLFSGKILQGIDLLDLEDNNKVMLTLNGLLLIGAGLISLPYGFILAEDRSNITCENSDNILLEAFKQ
jgi:hypothetical protein